MQIHQIRKLSPQILSDVVNIHLQELKGSFLTNFGKRFLERFYKSMAKNPNNIFLLLENNQEVVGFLLATKHNGQFNKDAVANDFFFYLVEVLKSSIWNPKLFIKVVQWLNTPKNAQKYDAELEFIAIKKQHQGQGLGSKLIKALDEVLKTAGIERYQVKTEAANPLSNKFYKSLNFEYLDTVSVFGKKFNYYCSPH